MCRAAAVITHESVTYRIRRVVTHTAALQARRRQRRKLADLLHSLCPTIRVSIIMGRGQMSALSDLEKMHTRTVHHPDTVLNESI